MISAYIITYNDEATIRDAICSLKFVTDKIVVAISDVPYHGESYKKDKTEDIALQEGCMVLRGSWKKESYHRNAQKTETVLRKEWGAAYEAKVDKAQKVINHYFAGKNIHKAFGALSSDEGFVKAMAEIAESMGEDSIAGAPRQTMTPKEAQSEINKMLGDTKHPFHNELSPEHSEAVNKYIELQHLAGM